MRSTAPSPAASSQRPNQPDRSEAGALPPEPRQIEHVNLPTLSERLENRPPPAPRPGQPVHKHDWFAFADDPTRCRRPIYDEHPSSRETSVAAIPGAPRSHVGPATRSAVRQSSAGISARQYSPDGVHSISSPAATVFPGEHKVPRAVFLARAHKPAGVMVWGCCSRPASWRSSSRGFSSRPASFQRAASPSIHALWSGEGQCLRLATGTVTTRASSSAGEADRRSRIRGGFSCAS